MAANRSASAFLIGLLMLVVMFLLFAMVTRLSLLGKHSYDLGYGWSAPRTQAAGECDRPLTAKGFPLKTSRPNADDSSGCSDETNALAQDMNLALYFAGAAIISATAASVIKNR
ncbi:MAG: hypothetical protein ACREJM_08610 [Candidatus Saccharimonadales bacterium]